MKIVVILILVWMAIGVSIIVQQIAKELMMEANGRKVCNLSFFQFFVVIALSMHYGAYTHSKVLAHLKFKE